MIFEIDDQLLIPLSVLIESCGMLVGRGKQWDRGFEMLAWVANPGTPILVINHAETIDTVRELVLEIHVDCVDAVLACLAHSVSEQCGMSPPLRIATLDTADFMRCKLARRLKLTLLDMRTLEEY
jgi:hypothetical protein